jgi:diguanylate cyclase (GGDEF)-like protein/PAS domain S-box-containing protein
MYVRGDGTTFIGRATLSAVADDAGQVDFILATLEDVTEQRRAETARRASESRFRALVDNSPDLIAILRSDGSWIGSQSAARLLGYTSGEDIEGGVFSLVHPDDIPAAQAALAEVVAGTRGNDKPHELRMRTVTGEYLDFECVGTNLGDHEAIRGVVITARNITERKRMEHALHAARAQFQAVFEHAQIVVSLLNLEGNIIDINYAGCHILGRTRQELVGTPGTGPVHPDDVDRVVEATLRQLDGSDESVEFRMVTASGAEVWVMSSASFIDPGGGVEPYVVSIQADITEQRRLQERLAREATRDPLTGVYNRGAFMTELELALSRRTSSPLALLFVDLDRFKEVNDSFGHEAGDAVLATIARRMQDCVRAGDVVARLGGDEFVVLCTEDIDVDEAQAVAERVRATTDEPVPVHGAPLSIGASVGVVLGHSGDDPTALLRAADAATYRAKQAGRGRVEVA